MHSANETSDNNVPQFMEDINQILKTAGIGETQDPSTIANAQNQNIIPLVSLIS